MNEFKRDIKSFLKKKNWNQARLAKELGISESTVHHWIKGDNFANSKTFYDLHKIGFRVDNNKEYLFFFAGFFLGVLLLVNFIK